MQLSTYHMGAKKQCFGCAAFNCFVARSDAVAELGSPFSGGSTAMDGGSVDIEGAFIDRHRELALHARA